MEILLTHGYFLNEDIVEQKVLKPYPPLGLLYVSGYLEKNGMEHDVFDSTFHTLFELRNHIAIHRPSFIGIYVNFLTRLNVLKIIEFVKKSDTLKQSKVILGGPDVKFHTEDYLGSGADFLVVGEGEVSFYELIKNLKSENKPGRVNGIVYKHDDEEIIFTKARDHVKNLDELPWPNRKKIDIAKYLESWKQKHGYNSITINTQRGCPYTCKWCSHAVFGDTYRRRSPASVVEEIAHLQAEFNPDMFWFVDDVFTMSEKWIEEFTFELRNRNLNISYECISRADKLNLSVIKNLKSSGCKLIWIGAESGSQNVIDLMDRRVDVHKVREMIKLAASFGIKTGTFIMLGYPGETREDILETIRHLNESDPDYFTINVAYPIKGTTLFDDVEPLIIHSESLFRTPDREIDFNRTYKRKFYDFAIRKIYNEVYAQKAAKNGHWFQYSKCKLKSIISTAGMQFYK